MWVKEFSDRYNREILITPHRATFCVYWVRRKRSKKKKTKILKDIFQGFQTDLRKANRRTVLFFLLFVLIKRMFTNWINNSERWIHFELYGINFLETTLINRRDFDEKLYRRIFFRAVKCKFSVKNYNLRLLLNVHDVHRFFSCNLM